MNKHLNLGLFGFGCVGQGLYDVLQQSQSFTADIKKIVVKHRSKPRKIDMSHFAFDKEGVLGRDDLNVVVELIDNSEEALALVTEAMNKKWDVVTANKKLIAENFEFLYKLAQEKDVALLYEGAVAGGIPILRNLEEYYDNELLSRVSGIINGSSNYILTKMEKEKADYTAVVKQAQELGFAEIDPWLDVAGYDAKFKLVILVVHAFGIILKPEQVLNLGINNITDFDIRYASEKEKRIKLIATAFKDGDKLRAYVLPHLVTKDTPLYFIYNENNAVEVEGAFSDKQLFTGKGAGSYPTGSAVLSDISALSYHYRYEFKKLQKNLNGNATRRLQLDTHFDLTVYIRYNSEEELKSLDIKETIEQYISPQNKYIIARVGFESLFNLMNRENKLFVCVLES
jgi:homoserine dehydrogenase